MPLDGLILMLDKYTILLKKVKKKCHRYFSALERCKILVINKFIEISTITLKIT
jgi:hypothetical protein